MDRNIYNEYFVISILGNIYKYQILNQIIWCKAVNRNMNNDMKFKGNFYKKFFVQIIIFWICILDRNIDNECFVISI